MACYSPLKGYRVADGRVIFSRPSVAAHGWKDGKVTVSCGQCIGCRIEKTRQWTLRIMHEAGEHEENCFLTLTYNDESIPDYGNLRVKDWQDFAKRLRHKIGPFRFFHCGEYGDETERPHYHACVFGTAFLDDRVLHKVVRGHELYSSAILNEAWGNGNCLIGELTAESAAYVAKYIFKKVNGKDQEEHYRRVDVETGEVIQLKPEYVTMSRNPGIGAKWIEKWAGDVYPRDELFDKGRMVRPPKFYDRQYAKLNSIEMEVIKERRVKRTQDRMDDWFERLGIDEGSWERMLCKERIQLAKAARFARDMK